ncbi:hypothetical protein [Sideroxydans sp. CL21]|nr:hypothetical protein [Sideroxydans sp. CL21]
MIMGNKNQNDDKNRNLRRIASEIYLTDPRYRICYFIPHPDQNLEEASPFQGATKGMVTTAKLLEDVMDHPADVRELSASWREIAFFRTAGLISHKVLPAEHSAFKQIVTWPHGLPFRCVISTDENAEFIDECLHSRKDEWLHVSTLPGESRHELLKLTRRTFLDYVRRRIDQMEGESNYSDMVPIIRSFLTSNLPGSRRIALPGTRHNFTRPNEIALQAFGCRLSEGHESPLTEKRAAQWIVRSVDFVLRRRRELLSEAQAALSVNALLLTLPATYRGHRKKVYINSIRRSIGTSKAPIGRIMRIIIDSPTYLIHAEEGELKEFFGNAMGQAMMAIRRAEMQLYCAILTRISAESLLPTLRLIPYANRAWGHLKHLADCARIEGPHKHRKLRRLYLGAQVALEAGLDDQFANRLQLLGKSVQGIKLVSDLPLEWLRIQGVPIMLRHECSRIPLVPSSLAYAVATDQDPVLIPPSILTDVLIIRSFDQNDQIRLVLEKALESSPYDGAAWRVNYRFVDVETPDEIVKALNSHAGAIVVFDCHGNFAADEYFSSLIVGGRPVRLWELRKSIKRMPPIVLLSACDTLPVDGSHASVASGMLQLGARTVLSTLLPIDSRKAAIFLCRLFFRIGEFVPTALRMKRRVSWREVVSGMTKMSHMTECLWYLSKQGMLDPTSFDQLHFEANKDINDLNPNWFERCVERLAKRLGCPTEEAWKYLSEDVGLTDALMHVQLGNPELLWLVGTEADSLVQGAANST